MANSEYTPEQLGEAIGDGGFREWRINPVGVEDADSPILVAESPTGSVYDDERGETIPGPVMSLHVGMGLAALTPGEVDRLIAILHRWRTLNQPGLTVAELDALPENAVVIGCDDEAAQKHRGRWDSDGAPGQSSRDLVDGYSPIRRMVVEGTTS
ncbi:MULTISPECIES: hypothetical protein [Nocardia]|uniref:hypothetical protein n=1 Tax=Nocardia TaxID=1817 RepID=UPI0024570A84|nr:MULTISPECIES: hypothetical protein [Nocardia]